MLSRANRLIEVEFLESGEFVLEAAGEAHLVTCIKELRERLATIELEVFHFLLLFVRWCSIQGILQRVSLDIRFVL